MSKDSEEGVKGGVSQLVGNPQLFPGYIILSLIPWFSSMAKSWMGAWQWGYNIHIQDNIQQFTGLRMIGLVWFWGDVACPWRKCIGIHEIKCTQPHPPHYIMWLLCTTRYEIKICWRKWREGSRPTNKDSSEDHTHERKKQWYCHSEINDINTPTVNTWGMVPDRNNSCFTSTRSWCCEQRTALLLPQECSGFQPSDGHYKRGLQNTLLGTAPHMSTDVTTCDQISQAFPVHTCILHKRLKTWRRGRPGNEAR